ncbi:kinase-like domain-containing protein, partial [Cyathus striatus]
YRAHAIIIKMMSQKRTLRKLSQCIGDDAQNVLDVLQMFLDHPLIPSIDKGYFRKVLILLATKSCLYPSSVIVEDISIPEIPIKNGHFGDVHKCVFHQKPVCLKILKIYQNDDPGKLTKEFLQELFLWNQLSHPNILPFYGAFILRNKSNRPCFISPWMEEGNIIEHIKRHGPNINRYLLISDIAEGVRYLHVNKIVHGDIKGVNILVNDVGRACLADFGLSNLLLPQNLPILTSATVGLRHTGTTRWQAPELFDEEAREITMPCDIYSYASTCYEIITGNVPYSEIKRDATVINNVLYRNKTPILPPDISGTVNPSFWNILQDCWKRNPEERPTIQQVIERLKPHIPDDARHPATIVPDSHLSPSWFRRLLKTQANVGLADKVEIILTEINILSTDGQEH